MPDCIPATIQIGGKLRRSKLEAFEELLPAAHNLDEIPLGEVAVYGEDGDASWGKFEELEAFCRENKLTYRRTTDARYEYNGEIVFWKPDLKDPIFEMATQDGKPYMTLERLKRR